MDKLKPCPFCGGEAVIRQNLGQFYVAPLHKRKCKMRVDTWLISSMPIKAQIAIWNRRTNDD